MKKLSIFAVLLGLSVHAETLTGSYELKSSKIDYLVKYLIKKADGASVASRGKGECKGSECDFLVAAPIKSFESKDANRDLNMLKTTKADKVPMVVAKIKAPADITSGKMLADLEIEFAGVKKNYSKIPFIVSGSGKTFKVQGQFDLNLDDHKIEKPSLLGVDIENLVPITISAEWSKI